MNWLKMQKAVARTLDTLLVFGAGALLDPNVSGFIGEHQGVATGVAVALAVLRALDKALGGKASVAIPPVA